MGKVLLFMIGAVILYFISVLVLFIMTVLLNGSFENLWLSAVPVALLSELLLLAWFLLGKYKKAK